MLKRMIDTFRTEKAYLFGIRKERTLACVSFSVDPHHETRTLTIFWFFFRLLRIAGCRLTKDFFRAFSKRPKYKDSYLELILLGTLPAFHGQGLGRMMLQFLYEFAKERGYHGIILDAAKDTPAYLFYLREGFVVDKEVSVGTIRLCNTRRVNRRYFNP